MSNDETVGKFVEALKDDLSRIKSTWEICRDSECRKAVLGPIGNQESCKEDARIYAAHVDQLEEVEKAIGRILSQRRQ